jgi:catechol 2,3-dioxygenase-like lactoylglutathione lyase family enzyme
MFFVLSPVLSTTPTEHTVLGFAVTDIDSTIAILAGNGVEVEQVEGFSYQANGSPTTPDASRAAWFRDPDGGLLSVVQFL